MATKGSCSPQNNLLKLKNKYPILENAQVIRTIVTILCLHAIKPLNHCPL